MSPLDYEVQKPKSSLKSITKIDIVVLSVLAVTVIAIFVLCYNFVTPTTLSLDSDNTQASATAITAPADTYEELIKDHSLSDDSSVSSELTSISYVADNENSLIMVELGCVGENINQLIETVFYPLADLDEDEKSAIEKNIRKNLSEISSEKFCKLTFSSDDKYFKIELNLTELDDEKNLQKLSDSDLIPISFSHPLKLTVVESDLLAEGFVRK